MSRIHLAIMLLLLAGLHASAQTQSANPAGKDNIEQQLIALEQKWMNAVMQSDTVAIKNILADEFVLTVAISGKPLEHTPRNWYIEACKGFYVVHSFSFDEFLVKSFGDMAVVSSRYRQKATLGGTQDRSAEFFLTDIWVKRDGRWQVVQRYSSRPEQE